MTIHGVEWGRKLVIGLASGHASGFAYGLTTVQASKLAEEQRSLSSRSTRYRDVCRPPLRRFLLFPSTLSVSNVGVDLEAMS